MSGPVLVIELEGPVSGEVIHRLRERLVAMSAGFRERRPGEYDMHVSAEHLGIAVSDGDDGRRPFQVSVIGPEIGDEETFAAEHGDEPDMKPLIGFHPTHAVDVIAFCNSQIDHLSTALLTAAVMDIVGGVANVEVPDDQVQVVAGLPGVIAARSDPSLTVFGTSEFLRRWADEQGFRLLK